MHLCIYKDNRNFIKTIFFENYTFKTEISSLFIKDLKTYWTTFLIPIKSKMINECTREKD